MPAETSLWWQNIVFRFFLCWLFFHHFPRKKTCSKLPLKFFFSHHLFRPFREEVFLTSLQMDDSIVATSGGRLVSFQKALVLSPRATWMSLGQFKKKDCCGALKMFLYFYVSYWLPRYFLSIMGFYIDGHVNVHSTILSTPCQVGFLGAELLKKVMPTDSLKWNLQVKHWGWHSYHSSWVNKKLKFSAKSGQKSWRDMIYTLHPRSLTAKAPEKCWEWKTFSFHFWDSAHKTFRETTHQTGVTFQFSPSRRGFK